MSLTAKRLADIRTHYEAEKAELALSGLTPAEVDDNLAMLGELLADQPAIMVDTQGKSNEQKMV